MAQVTKPFRSATDLKKPFKTPFLVPAPVEPAPEIEEEDRETSPIVPEDDDADLDVQLGHSKSSRPCAFPCLPFFPASVLTPHPSFAHRAPRRRGRGRCVVLTKARLGSPTYGVRCHPQSASQGVPARFRYRRNVGAAGRQRRF